MMGLILFACSGRIGYVSIQRGRLVQRVFLFECCDEFDLVRSV